MRNRTWLIVLLVLIILGGGAWWYKSAQKGIRYVDGVPSFVPDDELVEIRVAKLTQASVQKLPERFPQYLILGTEAEVTQSATRYGGDFVIKEVTARTLDTLSYLVGEYEKSFKYDGYAVTRPVDETKIAQVRAVKGTDEYIVTITDSTTLRNLHLQKITWGANAKR